MAPVMTGGPASARAQSVREHSEMQSAGKPLKILLVEDHEDTKVFMARLLRTFKHDVKTAGTVQDALALAGDNHFDLVISDLGLPDGDGFALMQALKEQYGLKGIALSGYGEDMTRSQEVGFMAHLTKPISFDQLQELIGKVAS
jgi:CheY-like chemotaxis protein